MATVSKATMRDNIYEVLYDLFTVQLSVGTVDRAFHDDAPTFPQVVINPSNIKIEKLTFRKDNKEYIAKVEVELYTKKNREIDQIADEITKDLDDYESTLITANLYLEDIDDSNSDTFLINDEKVHTKGIMLTFKINV